MIRKEIATVKETLRKRRQQEDAAFKKALPDLLADQNLHGKDHGGDHIQYIVNKLQETHSCNCFMYFRTCIPYTVRSCDDVSVSLCCSDSGSGTERSFHDVPGRSKSPTQSTDKAGERPICRPRARRGRQGQGQASDRVVRRHRNHQELSEPPTTVIFFSSILLVGDGGRYRLPYSTCRTD